MNYFHDDKLQKTRFFFGFQSKYIATYDLKDNLWGKTEFATIGLVSSINFFFKRKLRKNNLTDEESQLNEWFLIYTQHSCNSVIIGNVGTGKIARKVDLTNVNHISDCCLWNDGSSLE